MFSSSLLSRSGEIQRRRPSQAAASGATLSFLSISGDFSSGSAASSSSPYFMPGELELKLGSSSSFTGEIELRSSSPYFMPGELELELGSSSSFTGEIELRSSSPYFMPGELELELGSSSSFTGEIELRSSSPYSTGEFEHGSSSSLPASSSGEVAQGCAVSSASFTSKVLQCLRALSSYARTGATSGELRLMIMRYIIESGAELMGVTSKLLSASKGILISEATNLEGHCYQDLGCAWSDAVSLLSFWTGGSKGSTWNIPNPCGARMNMSSVNVQNLGYWNDTSYKNKNVVTLDSKTKKNPPIVVTSIPKVQKDSSLRAAKFKKGTTLGAFPYTEGWLLTSDSTLTTESDGPNKYDHKKLKTGKTNDRFVTMEAANLWISEILDMEIRSFICDNEEVNAHVCQRDGKEDYTHYIDIVNKTQKAIIEKIRIAFEWYSDGEFEKKYMEGFLILVDRMSKFCLAIRAEKRSNEDEFTLSAHVQSRASYGSPLVNTLFNKMSARKTLKEIREAVTRIMKIAAEDTYTGGVFSLFSGGRTSKWVNIHSDEFRVQKRKRSVIDKRFTMDEYENPLEKKELVFKVTFQVFVDLSLKPVEEGDVNMDGNVVIIDIEDFNVYVPRDENRLVKVSKLKEVIRHGSCASMLKYPTIFNSRIILRTGRKFLRDDDLVEPYKKIDVIVEEGFEVEVDIDGESSTLVVTEMTDVHYIKARLVKLFPNMDLRSRHLMYKDKKVGRNMIMFDLGVRSVPDKMNLLWNTDGDKDPMAQLQEMQKKYKFKLLKSMP